MVKCRKDINHYAINVRGLLMITMIIFIIFFIIILLLCISLYGFYVKYTLSRFLISVRKGRNKIIFMSLLCAIMLVCDGLSNHIFNLLQEQVVRSNMGHVMISKNEPVENVIDSPLYIINRHEIMAIMRDDLYLKDKIDFISEQLLFSGIVVNCSNQRAINFSGMGISPESSIKIGAFDLTVSGSELSNIDIKGITLDKKLADSIKVAYGDIVKLIFINDRYEKIEFITHVRGVFISEMKGNEYGTIKIPFEMVNNFFGANVVSKINIILKNNEDINSVIANIKNRDEIKNFDFKVDSWVDSNNDIKSIIYFLYYNLFFLKVIFAIFSFFLINRIISNSVDSSIEDISILNNLGMWRSYFCRIFLLEGLFIGFVISGLSLVIAMFFSFLINISLIHMPLSTGESYQLFVLWSDEYSYMYTVLLLISSFIASIHPAIKAVKSQHSV